MLQSLMANKDLYKSMYGLKGNKEFEMSVADWKFVEKYLNAFKPAFIAKYLQSFQLAMNINMFAPGSPLFSDSDRCYNHMLYVNCSSAVSDTVVGTSLNNCSSAVADTVVGTSSNNCFSAVADTVVGTSSNNCSSAVNELRAARMEMISAKNQMIAARMEMIEAKNEFLAAISSTNIPRLPNISERSFNTITESSFNSTEESNLTTAATNFNFNFDSVEKLLNEFEIKLSEEPYRAKVVSITNN
ncbi:unnamed protein product [Diamesa serratosioi]